MGDDSEHTTDEQFQTMGQAFSAGVRRGKEVQQQADAEDREAKEKKDDERLTFEKVQAMSQEEHMARKDEVDRFLEEQGRRR